MKLQKKVLSAIGCLVLLCGFTACAGTTTDTNITPTTAVTATAVPTAEPTEEPIVEPTVEPTIAPSSEERGDGPTLPEATVEPTAEPTVEPTTEPTAEPTTEPTVEPTATPTETPEPTATVAPTATPVPTATPMPTAIPTPTATPAPTKAPVASGPVDLTYDFNDLTYNMSYGTKYAVEKDGSISLQFEKLYQEIKLNLPEELDMNYCTGVTVKMKSEAGNLAVKLYDKDFKEVFVRYDGMTSGIADHKLAPVISDKVAGIGLMACSEMDDYSKFVANVYSVTFHMKAGYNSGEPTPKPTLAQVEKTGELVTAAQKHGFTFGIVMNQQNLTDGAYQDLLAAECTSVSFGNEMKAYSMLNQYGSQNSKNGMPVMNYSIADRMVECAMEQGVKIRGHVLVWDAYMSDWFFREGYKNDGAYVDRDTMLKRVEYYIEEVMTHFEEKYPGVVYCWDVVNEAVGDGNSDYVASDKRHVRTKRDGNDNMFYKIIGDDYVEISFMYAKNTVEKLKAKNPEVEIALFYNDYSTFYDQKRDAICELVKSINSYDKDASGKYRKLCDGVGMQSYIGGFGQQGGCMNSGDITRIKNAIMKFHDLGVDVHVTEMAARNYDKSQAARHAEFCGELFKAYAELNADVKRISNITVWGYCDNPYLATTDYSYKMNGPYCGLFNEYYEKKDSYYKAVEALK